MKREKPTVYVLHGLLGTAYGHFGNQIRAWSERFQVVPIDLPGHGRCKLDAGPNYLDGAYEYVVALMERFGPGRLVAASFLSGPLAVRCATERPELVTSLVLTGFAPDVRRDTFLGLLANFHRLIEDNPELAAEYDRVHTARWRATLNAFSAHVEREFETRVLVRKEQLGAVPAETLLINGALKSIEREAAANARSFGPRVYGQVLEGAGHIAGHDAPGPFNLAVERFWCGGELRRLLQETDSERPLDSLETVAVQTYLKGIGIGPPDEPTAELPTTIEGWGAWVAQRSLAS